MKIVRFTSKKKSGQEAGDGMDFSYKFVSRWLLPSISISVYIFFFKQRSSCMLLRECQFSSEIKGCIILGCKAKNISLQLQK
jgi:hypothetical protein